MIDRNAKSNINETPRRRKAGEKMSELIRQEDQDSDQEDCFRSDSNTPRFCKEYFGCVSFI